MGIPHGVVREEDMGIRRAWHDTMMLESTWCTPAVLVFRQEMHGGLKVFRPHT